MMKKIKKMNGFLALIFSSGTIVGLSMACLAVVTNILMSEPVSLHPALVWFSITSGLYAANRLIEIDKDTAVDNIISSTTAACKPLLLIFSVSMTLLGIFLAFYEKIELGIIIISTIFYFFLYTTDPTKIIFKKRGDA